MGVLGDLFSNARAGFRAASERDVTDERYWSTDGFVGVAGSGIVVDRDTALRVSCLFHGIRLYAEAAGSLPVVLYRQTFDPGRDLPSRRVAFDHYLWDTLTRQPNPWQTKQQFFETMTAWSIAYGKAHARIEQSPTNPVAALIPIDPELVVEEQLENGRTRYSVPTKGKTFVQEEMFTVAGFGLNGHVGESVLKLAREMIGVWIAHEKFRSTYFAQGASPGVWLKTPKKLSDQAYQRIKESAAQRFAGPRNWHKVQIAEEGLEPFAIGFDAEKSQMVESFESIVAEAARWVNVPLHMMKSTLQTTTYASAEQFSGEFVDYGLIPLFVRWEQSIDRDLIADDNVFARFLVDRLLRGKTLERAQAQQIHVNSGVKTRNEVRAEEDLNPLPGLDEPLTPVSSAQPLRPGNEKAPGSATPRRVELIVRYVARGLVLQERAQVLAFSEKLADKPDRFQDWLEKFYTEHAALVARRLELEPSLAEAYAQTHRRALSVAGISAAESWDPNAVEELVGLALEKETSNA